MDVAMTRPAIPSGLRAGGVVAIGRRVPAETAPGRRTSSGRRRCPRLRADPQRARSRRPSFDRGGRPGRGRSRVSRSAPARSSRSRPPNAPSTRAPRSSSAPTWTRRSSPGPPAAGSRPSPAAPPRPRCWPHGERARPRSSSFRRPSLGPAFIRELRGPFPDIPVVPTGGVTVESAPSFIAAGAIAVGMGGWLLGDGEVAGIRERAALVVAAVAGARAGTSR